MLYIRKWLRCGESRGPWSHTFLVNLLPIYFRKRVGFSLDTHPETECAHVPVQAPWECLVCREKAMTDLTLPPHAELHFSVMLRTSGEEIHLSPQLSDFLPASFPLKKELLDILSCNRDSVGL